MIRSASRLARPCRSWAASAGFIRSVPRHHLKLAGRAVQSRRYAVSAETTDKGVVSCALLSSRSRSLTVNARTPATLSYRETQQTTLMRCIWHGNMTHQAYTSRGRHTFTIWRTVQCPCRKLFNRHRPWSRSPRVESRRSCLELVLPPRKVQKSPTI